MSENTVTEQGTKQTEEQSERTFTQSEMDAIISDRLNRERAKYPDYESLKTKAQKLDKAEQASKTDLEKVQEKVTALQAQIDSMNREKTMNDMKAKVSSETGVPASLLTGSTEEVMKTAAQGILAFAKGVKPTYLTVKDGGEVHAPAMSLADIRKIPNERQRVQRLANKCGMRASVVFLYI